MLKGMFGTRTRPFCIPDGGAGDPPPATKTFTQSEIDAALEAERKKYEGFDDLKKAKEELDKLKASQLSELEKLQTELAAAQAELEKSRAAVKAAERAALCRKLCAEAGLPEPLADRIAGDDEISIKKDIEALKKLIPAKPVGGTNPPAEGDKKPKTSGDPLRDAIAGYYKKD